MANYISFSRSSYFKVKNEDDFKKFCDKWGVELISKEFNKETLYGFLGKDEGGIPAFYYDQKTDEWIDDQDGFIKDLSELLHPDWVAVIQEIGYEKMRYLVGYSLMIDSEGNTTVVNIDDIYKKVRGGKNYTVCMY